MSTTTFDTIQTTTPARRPTGGPVSAKARDAFIHVIESAHVQHALDAARKTEVPPGQASMIFLIDDRGRYRGFVRVSALLRADGAAAVTQLLGFLVPYALVKAGVDHAPGADPFITTIKDFTGLLVYFSMAVWLLGLDYAEAEEAAITDEPAAIVEPAE